MKSMKQLGLTALSIFSGALAQTGHAERRSQPPLQLFLSSAKVDLKNNSVTLPLYHGQLQDGRAIWYVLTDTDNEQRAKDLGINYSSLLSSMANGPHTRHAFRSGQNELIFDKGTVDFSPDFKLVAGAAPDYFPPQVASPGSLADADYSPFVKVDFDSGTEIPTVYNAPIVAFDVKAADISFCNGNANLKLVHDKVLSICPEKHEVTLALTHGFSDGKEVVYLSFDANVQGPATMEKATLISPTHTGRPPSAIDLVAIINGDTGKDNPNRQGFDSALLGEGSPLNILSRVPGQGGYSPLWDVKLAQWTAGAIANSDRGVLRSIGDVNLAHRMQNLFGSDGGEIQSGSIFVNCPVVGIFQ